MSKNYDYIFAGSGLAGLSLLYRLLTEEEFCKKRVLVIDQSQKNQNDRTWCFWERDNGPFEQLISKQWSSLRFFSPSVTREFALREYRYKMIQSGDFYRHVLDFVAGFPNVEFLKEKIEEIGDSENGAFVKTENNTYTADFVFNSTSLFYPIMGEENTLLQHFMGWFIQCEQPVFDAEVGTLMDFTVSQFHGTTFMYMLPITENEALVEYTLFSRNVLGKSSYEIALREYIKNNLQLDDYKILHREFGVIPMSKAKFPRYVGEKKRIINIGTAGGHTKASSGYTFQFVQDQVSRIVGALKKGESPLVTLSWRDKMFQWYDMTLLDVLLDKKIEGEELFSLLFKGNDPERILAFLANESGFWEEFKIRNSVPFWPFFTSGMKELYRGIRL
ncbi:lycopene cyclase family protein [Arthrospiribacter ruber]|uniref:Lycopene cyclase n=1 Tax=Arthrospiribacter ruber TaxID=2487934 RepID=A0A951IZ83_9BACT|nr:lycopene cyclase family protein [Arthrospiribacter ruber]MBW3468248.1 lycopene cyclase [Arthrospiribacter ruber]